MLPLLKIAFTFFLVANPIGNSPALIALIKDFDFDRQKKIMLRESFLALCLALFFQYFGEVFLRHLNIEVYTLRISGGVLLLIVSLGMIFSIASSKEHAGAPLKREPLFVPIATPLITGPALLTIIMITSQQEQNDLMVSFAICITWIGVTICLVAAPYLNKILKKRGMAALEQLMGLFLTMMAVGMIVNGLAEFIQARESAHPTKEWNHST